MSDSSRIRWSGGEVTGVWAGDGPIGILLAHGAGTDQNHPSMTAIRAGLAGGGHRVLSFNYPYTERGSKRPDRTETLLACHLAAADALAAEVGAPFLAGRSMGGRMGTYLAAEGYVTRGLVLYAYPLHPAGRTDKLRIEQFGSIAVPMLFFQGSNDALSRLDLFHEHIAVLPNAEVEMLEGAGHGFRGGGWDLDRIVRRYVTGTLDWIGRLSSGTSQ